MKASELRIGNLVIWNHIQYDDNGIPENKNDLLAITELREDVCTVGKSHLIDYSEISPVTLTEEWFVRFGFEKGVSTNFIHGKFRIWIAENENKIFVFYDEAIRLEIQYVHQLQNLYFALTGEELELK